MIRAVNINRQIKQEDDRGARRAQMDFHNLLHRHNPRCPCSVTWIIPYISVP